MRLLTRRLSLEIEERSTECGTGVAMVPDKERDVEKLQMFKYI